MQLSWLSMVLFTFAPGSPGIPRPPSIPVRPWVAHSSQIGSSHGTVMFYIRFFYCQCQNLQYSRHTHWFSQLSFESRRTWQPPYSLLSKTKIRACKEWDINWCCAWCGLIDVSQGWKLFVLTAWPLSPLFPLRPAGPGPPCIIERIQQTWLDIHRSLN